MSTIDSQLLCSPNQRIKDALHVFDQFPRDFEIKKGQCRHPHLRSHQCSSNLHHGIRKLPLTCQIHMERLDPSPSPLSRISRGSVKFIETTSYSTSVPQWSHHTNIPRGESYLPGQYVAHLIQQRSRPIKPSSSHHSGPSIAVVMRETRWHFTNQVITQQPTLAALFCQDASKSPSYRGNTTRWGQRNWSLEVGEILYLSQLPSVRRSSPQSES